MPRLQIMDTTIRDGQQSLWATRMPIGDMLPILPKMDRVGYWAIEAWGGATFDSCMRFLDENPWERLRAIKANTPNTPLSMLSRGQNLVGYKHYSREIVDRFIGAAHRNGIEVFRVFDALNDIRNVVDNAEAIKEHGGLFEGAISYTISPVHTLDSYLEYAQQLKDLGADTIAIKDMAGMLTPYRAERMVKALNEEIGLPVHIHCHYVGGMAPANILKAAEAGAAVADTASAPLAFGNSLPAVEMIVAALKESRYDTDLDLDLLFEIAEYWEEMRKRGHYKRGVSSLIHMQVYSHQVPGGMMSNLISQLEVQKAADRLLVNIIGRKPADSFFHRFIFQKKISFLRQPDFRKQIVLFDWFFSQASAIPVFFHYRGKTGKRQAFSGKVSAINTRIKGFCK